MKLGIIGLDSSHGVEFSRILNRPEEPFFISGHPVTAAYEGDISPDFDMSYERMEKFSRQVTEEFGVSLYENMKAVLEQVDGVLLEQVDARKRLTQFQEIISYKKPVFVDKPFALNTKECHEMFQMAEAMGVPVLSTSSLRFADALTAALDLCSQRIITGADFYGPMPFTETQPGYFWYGVHMADMLYRTMGRGCRRVTVVHTQEHDVVTGVWEDGRIGTIRGSRAGTPPFGGLIYHEHGVAAVDVSKDRRGYYECLMEQIILMFDTGISPVEPGETEEVVRFLEAANESLQTGQPVEL